MRGWSAELINLAIEHFCEVDKTQDCDKLKDELKTGLKQLDDAFDARAFGSRRKIREAARKLASWSEKLAGRVNKVYPTPASTRVLLKKMPTLYDGKRLLDYDTARVVSWALWTMYLELYGPTEPPKSSDPCKEGLYPGFVGSKGNPQVWKTLKNLDKVVKLRLPMRTDKDNAIERELTDNLERIKEYDGLCFSKLFSELGTALKNGK
jgi:hypothetical protein